MGGFAFDLPTSSDSGQSPTTALTRWDIPKPKAFLYIMKNFPDIIPDITEESITDRAESSVLSNALLIVQVGWFCANCLSRLMQHLPLSLIEISTVARGFCALVTYFVWWSKPQNVAGPIPMKGQRAREVHALFMCPKSDYYRALSMARRMAAGDSAISINGNEQGRIVLAANALQHLLPSPEAPPEDPFYGHFWSSSPASCSNQMPIA
jgi:hypothetical protein